MVLVRFSFAHSNKGLSSAQHCTTMQQPCPSPSLEPCLSFIVSSVLSTSKHSDSYHTEIVARNREGVAWLAYLSGDLGCVEHLCGAILPGRVQSTARKMHHYF